MTFSPQHARELVRCAKAKLQGLIINLGRTPERIEKMRQLYELEDCLKHLSSTDPDRAWTAMRDCALLSPGPAKGLLLVVQIVPLRLVETGAATPRSHEDGTEHDAIHYDCPHCGELYPLIARRTPPATKRGPTEITISVLCLRCLRLSPIAQSDD